MEQHTRRVPLFAIAALLATAVASAQERSDFTGTWTRVDRTPSADSSHVERVVQGRDHVLVQTEEKGSAGPLGYRGWGEHAYTIGGAIETKKDAQGRVRSLAVGWDGPHLVFVRTTTEGENTRIERETWSLADDGLFLRKDRCTADWQGTSNSQEVYRRSEGNPILKRPSSHDRP